MPRILLLMPSTTYRATDFLAAAHRMGIEVTVGTDRRQTLEEHTPGTTATFDLLRPDEAVRQMVAFARDRPLDAIVPVDDETAVLAARASEALGLPSNPVEAVQAAGDKERMRALLLQARLPVPAFRVVSLDRDPAAAAREGPFPCVLKPTFLSASRGVIRADDAEGFAAAFHRLAALLRRPEVAVRGGDRARRILVEAFVPGPEFALEGLLSRGRLQTLALFDKPDPLEGPYFEETLYVTPSRLPGRDQARIASAVSAAATAMGLREGPIHAEVRLHDGAGFVIDLAARSIGGLCSRALRFGTGLTLEDVILRHALGRKVAGLRREEGASGVLMLPIPGAGILQEVRGLEEARATPGVIEIDLTIPCGQQVVPLPDGDRYLGFVFARADSPERVEAALRQARRRLEVRIEGADG